MADAKCTTCARDPSRMNGPFSECSHVDCLHRRTAWSGAPHDTSLRPQPQVSHGYTCWCGRHESPAGESQEAVLLAAMVAGWKIGLGRDGNAYYTHPKCTYDLFDTTDLVPDGWRLAGRIRTLFGMKPVSGTAQLREELAAGRWYQEARCSDR